MSSQVDWQHDGLVASKGLLHLLQEETPEYKHKHWMLLIKTAIFVLKIHLQFSGSDCHVRDTDCWIRLLEALEHWDHVFKPGSDVIKVRHELLRLLRAGMLVPHGLVQLPALNHTWQITFTNIYWWWIQLVASFVCLLASGAFLLKNMFFQRNCNISCCLQIDMTITWLLKSLHFC